MKDFCVNCNCYHEPHGCGVVTCSEQSITSDLKVLHRNCDPAKMSYEDHLVWERYNRKFNDRLDK